MASILLVEDNPGIVVTLSGQLEADGHNVVACRTAAEAVGLIGEGGQFDVALVDYWLEQETAEPVLSALRTSRPDTKVLLITGGSPSSSVETTRWLGALDGIDGFLQKPFLRRDLQTLFKKFGL